MELINKDTLLVEIEKKKIQKDIDVVYPTYLCALMDLEDFIDTLEVKEVDLVKEYDNEFFKDPVFGKLVNRTAGISIAKHFFELGLKTKGE